MAGARRQQTRKAAPRRRQVKRTYYKGRGKYTPTTTTVAAKQPKAEKTAVQIGKSIGKSIGGALGQAGGFMFNHFFGRGGYTVQNNSLMRANPGNPDMPPIINSMSKDAIREGGVLFRKTEYLGDIISGSAGTFDLNRFAINPGMSETFPWLSQCAQNFAQYEIIGMYFEYRSMSADSLNSTNTALGQIILGTNYNSAEADFGSKNEMENYENSISVKPSQSVRYFVECSPSVTPVSKLYVRSGAVPTGQDIRLYDLGAFQIATNGLQASNVNLGELWVCYEVVCYKSKLFSTLINNCDYFLSRSYAGYINAQPLGGFVTDLSTNTLAMVVEDNELSFPGEIFRVRQYLVHLEWTGSSIATLTYPTLGPSNIYLSTVSYNPQNSAANVTSASIFFLCRIEPGVLDPFITFGAAGALPGSGTGAGRLMVTEIAEDITYTFFN